MPQPRISTCCFVISHFGSLGGAATSSLGTGGLRWTYDVLVSYLKKSMLHSDPGWFEVIGLKV